MQWLYIILVFIGLGFIVNSFRYRAIGRMTRDQLKSFIKDRRGLILDLRTNEAYTKKKIPSSQLLPLGQVRKRIGERVPDKKTPLVVYGERPADSRRAAKILHNLGYEQVYNFGSFAKWQAPSKQGSLRKTF